MVKMTTQIALASVISRSVQLAAASINSRSRSELQLLLLFDDDDKPPPPATVAAPVVAIIDDLDDSPSPPLSSNNSPKAIPNPLKSTCFIRSLNMPSPSLNAAPCFRLINAALRAFWAMISASALSLLLSFHIAPPPPPPPRPAKERRCGTSPSSSAA